MSHESPLGGGEPASREDAPTPPAQAPAWGPQHATPPPPTAYPPPVAYTQYPAPAPPVPTNGLAIASLVLGVVSWIPFLWIGFIPGLVLGFVGKRQVERSGGTQQGRGLAIAGIVLGLVGCAIMVAFFVLFLVAGLSGAADA